MIAEDIKTAYSRTKWSLIIRGLFGIAIGVLIFARPLASVAAFALVIALWALFDGITNIARALSLRGVAPHWGAILGVGILGIVFGGAALYYYPALSLAFAVTWAAIWLTLRGIAALYIGAQERKLGISHGWTIAFGVIAVIAGILALVYPRITLGTLMVLIAAFGIIGGIAMLIGAAKLGSLERHFDRATADIRSGEAERSRSDMDDRRGSHAA